MGLKPVELPEKIKVFLERYDLSTQIDDSDIEELKTDLHTKLEDINSLPALAFFYVKNFLEQLKE